MNPEDLIRSSSAHMLLIEKRTGRVVKTYGATDMEITSALRDGKAEPGEYALVYTDGRPVDLTAPPP
jgi:hypothetical protein